MLNMEMVPIYSLLASLGQFLINRHRGCQKSESLHILFWGSLLEMCFIKMQHYFEIGGFL